jgi:hypothetical protein
MGINSDDWRVIGTLCNAPETHESRHRGKNVNNPTRPATPEERELVMTAARSLIATYLRHLGVPD